MSAIELMHRCQSAAIRLQVRGERLHIVAPRGCLTPAIKQALVDHKTELLALVTMRDQLQALAAQLGIPPRVVDSLPPEELQAAVEQLALAEGHLDGNGDPLPCSLLIFYLKSLAAQVSC